MQGLAWVVDQAGVVVTLGELLAANDRGLDGLAARLNLRRLQDESDPALRIRLGDERTALLARRSLEPTDFEVGNVGTPDGLLKAWTCRRCGATTGRQWMPGKTGAPRPERCLGCGRTASDLLWDTPAVAERPAGVVSPGGDGI